MSELTLITSAIPFDTSLGGRVVRNARSTKMYAGCQKAPMRFFPAGVSMAVLPPTEESTMARRVVGIWTNLTPRMLHCISWARATPGSSSSQCRSDETSQIPNDTSSKGNDDGIPNTLLTQHPVLNLSLDFSALCSFSRLHLVHQQSCFAP